MTAKQQSQQVALNIRLLAEKHNLTPYDLEKVCNIKNQNIYRVYGGKFSPNIETVFQLLGAINQATGEKYSLKDIDFVKPTSEAL